MSYTQVFQEIVTALDRASIPYMVVGSFASNLYGTGRGTQDIDPCYFGITSSTTVAVEFSSENRLLLRPGQCCRSSSAQIHVQRIGYGKRMEN